MDTDNSTTSKEDLETCDVCGEELSVRAEACPHCGDPKFHGDPVSGCISGLTKGAMALILLYALVAVGTILENSRSDVSSL